MTRVLVRDQKDKRHTRGRDLKTEVKIGDPAATVKEDRTHWRKAEVSLEPWEVCASVNESRMLSFALSLFLAGTGRVCAC